MLTLYHWEPNTNSGKPMLTLAEKGVEYESPYLDLLKFDQHQPEYLQINPDGQGSPCAQQEADGVGALGVDRLVGECGHPLSRLNFSGRVRPLSRIFVCTGPGPWTMWSSYLACLIEPPIPMPALLTRM